VKAEVLTQSKGGVWAWLFQRITAVLLIIGFTSHLISTHIQAIGELNYRNIETRLGSAFFVVMDVMLLAAVLYHALNGVRMVVLDYWCAARSRRTALAVFLWVVGLAAFAYGLWALWPWITG
jgi:succinate dehydrogenase cytochrome b556 subunit